MQTFLNLYHNRTSHFLGIIFKGRSRKSGSTWSTGTYCMYQNNKEVSIMPSIHLGSNGAKRRSWSTGTARHSGPQSKTVNVSSVSST